MRFLALILCGLFGSLSPGLASEMPEDLQAYLQRQGVDREEKTLEQWLQDHGRERPETNEAPVDPLGTTEKVKPRPEQAPTPLQKHTAPPAPFLPEITQPAPSLVTLGKGQPLAVTLVHMLDGPAGPMSASGCPPDDPSPLLDDGIAPDTRAKDKEHTAFVPLCPLGETTVRFFVNAEEVWSWDYSAKSQIDAPSLRVLHQSSGFSLDTGAPEDQPHSVHRVGGPQQELGEDAKQPLIMNENEEQNAGVWIGLSLMMVSLALGWRHRGLFRNPDSETTTESAALKTQARKLHPPPPVLAPIPPKLRQAPLGIQRLAVDNSASQRALTYALALHHSQDKTVLLLADPKNKKTYTQAFSNQDDVTWFNGKPLTGTALIAVLLGLGADIGLVLIEGAPAIAGNNKDLQKLVGKIQHPVVLIQHPNTMRAQSDHYSLCDGEWRLSESA
jgi:hypothetical protein